jgi:hypothetical protein
VTSFEYSDILRRKVMERVVATELGKANKRRRKKSEPNEH